MKKTAILLTGLVAVIPCFSQQVSLKLNDRGYFEMPGLNVMVFQDIYPEGHQGGISIIQNGVRVATNGDLLLEPTLGQWQPVPKPGERVVDTEHNEISMSLSYPDPDKNGKGYNPIQYPDLHFNYTIVVKPEGSAVRVCLNLDRPLPEKWIGKVGFTMELYPANLFGKTWYLGGHSGIFPRQANGPVQLDDQGNVQPVPYATGDRLVIAPESDGQRMTIESKTCGIELLDGRTLYNNGWFVVRSQVPSGATAKAVEWIITPNAIPGWKYKPVIHTSQVGYHPDQQKIAVIELDASDNISGDASLMRISEDGKPVKMYASTPELWGSFLRYTYCHFDFSAVKQEGMYYVQYCDSHTEPFRISREVFKRHVWQPVLEYFLPVQMCHMQVNEKYRVWHGVCHLDDALMAPVNHNHFDGYLQGGATFTSYKPGDAVPGLNAGGWHDAGDDDLRIESQAGEVYILSLIYESFNIKDDNTSIDQMNRHVEIHQPDGKPDVLQQIEHGMLTILGGYRSLGRLYRGIISPSIQQYVMTGDVSNQTDNLVYDPELKLKGRTADHSGRTDDRWVFTEENPAREFEAIACIAAASRVLREYNPALSGECLGTALKLWQVPREVKNRALVEKIHAAIELYITTGKDEYRQFILANQAVIEEKVSSLGWVIGRALPLLNDQAFTASVRAAVSGYVDQVKKEQQQNPFGVPYEPVIWGAGWNIQEFGVEQYFLHTGFPDIAGKQYMLNALDFVLGCHPGENTASFASGVGSRSLTAAYGYNRADWSYIPGGVASGTALIRPDFPELKDFPFLWQQAEYVMGGGSTNFMFLVLAADQLLNK